MSFVLVLCPGSLGRTWTKLPTEINYTEFVNKELVLFSMADCQRSIPSAMDGLKPGQRKILFSCFKRKLKNDVKVRCMSLPASFTLPLIPWETLLLL